MRYLRIFLLFAILFCGFNSRSQSGQEWINFNQSYYKVEVLQAGVYSLSFNTLGNAGLPLSTIDPRRFKMYHRGQEIAIRVTGQDDASFDPGDQIEFFGQPSDGALEQEIAIAPRYGQRSVYSDKSSYFLTWTVSGALGRRVDSYVLNNPFDIPAEDFAWRDTTVFYEEIYSGGKVYPEGAGEPGTRYSQQDEGEGWTSTDVTKRTTDASRKRDFEISNLYGYSPVANPEYRALLTGRNSQIHRTQLRVGPSTTNLRETNEVSFSYWTHYLQEGSLQPGDISPAGNFVFSMEVLGNTPTTADRQSLAYLQLRYPRDFIFQGSSFFSLNSKNGDTAVIASQLPANARLWDISDPASAREIGYSALGGGLSQAVILNVRQGNRYYVFDRTRAATLRPVLFRDLMQVNPQYVIVYNQQLNSAIDNFPVRRYAQFRASAEGGSYDTLSISLETLIDQFAYGEPSPVAIYRFGQYLIDRGETEYVFLIGKGYYPGVRGRNQFEGTMYPAGFPGSDAVYTSRDNQIRIPIGRLPAKEGADVSNYLDKAGKYATESFTSLWRKRAVHLSGGVSETELFLFSVYLGQFENIAEGAFLGGQVETIYKQNTSITPEPLNISEQVNDGLGLITFFGHSAPNVIDIDIGFATNPIFNYNNQDRFPLILLNGCEGGNIFRNSLSFAEDWMNAGAKGAIGVLAHSYYGYPSQLRTWSDLYYRTAYADSAFISESWGNIYRKVNNDFLNNISNPALSPRYVAQFQQFLFQGDPAIVPFPTSRPDFSISDNGISVNPVGPNRLDAASDSLQVEVALTNFGVTLSAGDSLGILITRRKAPENTILSQDTIYLNDITVSQDTLRINILNQGGNSGAGINRFEVTIDPEGLYNELRENNNFAFIEVAIPLTTSLNLYPYDRMIIDSLPVILSWQSSDPLDDDGQFEVQVDTSRNFDSPFLQSSTIEARGIGRWQPDFQSIFGQVDTIALYWRTRDLRQTDEDWFTSVFYYLSARKGWGAFSTSATSDFEASNLSYQEDQDMWQFDSFDLFLSVVSDTVTNSSTSTQIEVNNEALILQNVAGRVCAYNNLLALAIDDDNLQTYGRGIRECGRFPREINALATESHFSSYIGSIPDGDYVLLVSLGKVAYSNYSNTILQELESIGVASGDINSLQDSVPLIILGRKGSTPGEATIQSASDPSGFATFSRLITEPYSSATFSTPLIGPAYDWEMADFAFSGIQDQDVTVQIYADELLLDQLSTSRVDLGQFAADEYPYLRFRLLINDPLEQGFPGVPKFAVDYTPRPELSLYLPDLFYQSLPQRSVPQGRVYSDSLLVLNLSNELNRDSLIFSRQLAAGDRIFRDTTAYFFDSDSLWISMQQNTAQLTGEYDLNIGISHLDPQLINNQLRLPAYLLVEGDRLNPVVQVRIDGRLIVNGDIVSPDPLIEITAIDKNPYLKLNDTTALEMFLKAPCEGCDFSRLRYSDPRLDYTFDEGQNQFKVSYQGSDLENGEYTLRVQALDAAGNAAGEEAYEVSFEVVRESSLTNVYPYPNPFSTRTRFIFTLTGNQLPDEFSLRIFTIGGRLVREVSYAEFGPIRIGHNISDYFWDGRDQFGDQLANGVYLYTVDARINGEKIELRSTAGDQAFKNGFGKIYLLR